MMGVGWWPLANTDGTMSACGPWQVKPPHVQGVAISFFLYEPSWAIFAKASAQDGQAGSSDFQPSLSHRPKSLASVTQG